MNLKNIFWACLYLILIQPYIQSEFSSFFPLVIYLGYFLLSIKSIQILNDTELFWKNHNVIQKHKDFFILKGNHLAQAEPDQEDNYIDQMGVKKRAFRLMASLLVMLTPPVFIILGFLPKDFFFKGSNIIFFTLSLAVINSSYQGHLILIATLSLVVTLFMSTWSYFLSVPILIFLFLAIVNLSKELIEQANNESTNSFKFLSVVKIGTIFVLCAYLIQLALPKELSWVNEKKWLENKLKSPMELPKPPQKSPSFLKNIKMTDKKLDGVIDALNGLELNINNIPNMPLNFKADLQSMQLEAKDIKRQLNNPNLTPDQMKKLADKLKGLKLKIKMNQKSFEEYQNQLIDNSFKFPSEAYEQTKKGIKNQKIEDAYKNIPELKIENIEKSLVKEANKTQDYLKSVSQQKDKQVKEKNEIIKKEKKKKDLLHYGKLFSRVLVSFLVFFILLLLLRKKKKNVKDLKDEKILKQIKRDYNRLKRLKLTPEEEVIHKYNFLKDSLKKIYFEDDEVPPPYITHEFISGLKPRLHKVSLIINEVFTHCFYNDRSVSKKDLSLFRKSFNLLFSSLLK